MAKQAAIEKDGVIVEAIGQSVASTAIPIRSLRAIASADRKASG